MTMQFIETALNCTSRFALVYADPNQKWIIREHLTSLLQDFPSLKPSIDTFTYNDGATVTLLNANGEIHISASAPPLSLTIWLHENYPITAPAVFINTNSIHNFNFHPFVDCSSGAATSSYLQNWQPNCSDLSGLVRNLVNVFSSGYHKQQRPFYPSHVSKREAIDRLACSIYSDVAALRAKTEEDIDGLSVVQAELVKRGDVAANSVLGLEYEYGNLQERVEKLTDQADVLLNWLKVHGRNSTVATDYNNIDDAFEAVDEKSRIMLNCLAADRAMEDLMYALDEAVEREVLTIDICIKQVRNLARAQFEYRSELIKLGRF